MRPDGEPQYEKFKELHFRQYADIAEAQLQQKVGIIQQQTESQRVVIEAEGIAKREQWKDIHISRSAGLMWLKRLLKMKDVEILAT